MRGVEFLRSLPFVERSLNWVRVAQRFPVRIRLEDGSLYPLPGKLLFVRFPIGPLRKRPP